MLNGIRLQRVVTCSSVLRSLSVSMRQQPAAAADTFQLSHPLAGRPLWRSNTSFVYLALVAWCGGAATACAATAATAAAAVQDVPRCVLQLLAVACMMLAAKDLEVRPSSSSSELMAAAVATVAGVRLARHAAAEAACGGCAVYGVLQAAAAWTASKSSAEHQQCCAAQQHRQQVGGHMSLKLLCLAACTAQYLLKWACCQPIRCFRSSR